VRRDVEISGSMNELKLTLSDKLSQTSTDYFFCKAEEERGERISLSHSPAAREEAMKFPIDGD